MTLSLPARKILYLAVLSLVVPVVICLVLASLQARRSALDQAGQEGRQMVSSLTSQNALLTENTGRLLQEISVTGAVRSADRTALRRVLTGVLRKTPDYENMFLVDRSGTLVAAAHPLPGFSAGDHPTIAQALAGKKPGPVVMASAEEQGSRLLYICPVADAGGNITAALGVTVLPKVFSTNQNTGEETTGQIRVHGGKGEVLYSRPSGGWVDRSIGYEWEALQNAAPSMGELSLTTPTGGPRVLIYEKLFAADEETPYMTVVYSLSEAGATATADYRFVRDLLSLGLITFLILVISSIVANKRVGRPLKDMADTMRSLREGLHGARPEAIDRQDEMGLLARSFASMAETFESRESDLNGARNTATVNSKARSVFLGNISHEIRVPIRRIIGFSEAILQSSLNDKARYYTEKILASGISLNGITGAILDFARLDSGKMRLDQVPFSLDDLLKKSLDEARQLKGDRPLNLTARTEADVPRFFRGDPVRLGQILSILMNNAVKFSQEGDILLNCRLLDGLHVQAPERPVPDGSPDPDGTCTLAFTVTDPGIGIPADLAESVFSPFIQADGSSTRQFGGTGLGLSIAQSLVGLMGGTIKVASQPDFGSEFTFTVKLEPLGEAAKGRPFTASKKLRERILLADRNPVEAVRLRDLLNDQFYRADLSLTLDESLSRLKQADGQGNPYSLVFMDWRWIDYHRAEDPGVLVNGWDLSVPPRLVILAAAGEGQRAVGQWAGGTITVLPKPVQAGRLREFMDSI